jgi:hypothetical protein
MPKSHTLTVPSVPPENKTDSSLLTDSDFTIYLLSLRPSVSNSLGFSFIILASIILSVLSDKETKTKFPDRLDAIARGQELTVANSAG